MLQILVWKEESFGDLEMAKIIIKGNPWVIIRDFNVTLKLDEHSAGKLIISGDMKDFIDCVNNIKVEDVCWFGMHFTWIKSPSNPATSILKKLDKVMANEDFIAKYNQAYAIFHPFLVSDHSHMGDIVEGSKVAKEFVQHFNNFLEKSSKVDHVDSLGNIFSTILGIDDANVMVKKKAWSIVGKDVCLAVKDFFSNGKLFMEVNSTLISLIPKVQDSISVTDFRSIACCNVIYKCISKILTNKIKGGLDKLINLNQSAFIQGRSTQDNILLTQELLNGYNRKSGPKRCSLKIDIAKAYDTVSWDFLRNILIKFWYFQRGRGLRQGDLISPYLFTLVMEVFTLIVDHKIRNSGDFKYHVGCKDLKLTHLCFADDLLVLCHGDKGSIKIIKDSIDDFSRVSGLVPNLNKSTIFFGNVNLGTQRSILNIVPFKVGVFPVKYLGVPLLTKRLGKDDCKHLVDKVKSKVNDWKNKYLSYAGRFQLIASVLGSMQIYWASVFLLPKSTVKDIEKVLKGFRFNNNASLADMIDNNKWKWHNEWKDVFPEFITVPVPTCNNHKDKAVWRCNNGTLKGYSTKQVRRIIKFSIPRSCMDSHDHLFFQCSFSSEIWNIVKDKSYIDNLKSNWDDSVRSMALFNKKAIKDIVRRLVFSDMIGEFTSRLRVEKISYKAFEKALWYRVLVFADHGSAKNGWEMKLYWYSPSLSVNGGYALLDEAFSVLSLVIVDDWTCVE
ncbi:RNA-directed DNA polymerase, eukaryota, reverse transcriptase zinc-binding domain protein [Tanacetum coccineum]